MYNKNFVGLEGFIWFMGIVENRLDPLKLGRCQVRIFGWHTDNKSLIPTEDLPWAQPLLPINDSSTTNTPKEGDMVVGFFTDGESAQMPIIFGVLPGIPEITPTIGKGFSDPRTDLTKSPKKPKTRTYKTDGSGGIISEGVALRYPDVLNEPSTSRVARNEKIETTLIQERKNNVVDVSKVTGSWNEPTTKYASVFPYNKVTETESGHLFEIDDTPGAERISNTHRSGTFEEIHPDGSKVTKVVKNNYQIVMADDNVYVMGSCNLTIQGESQVYVKGNASLKIDGDHSVDVKGNASMSVAGNYNLDVKGNANMSVGGVNNLSVGSKFDLNVGTDYKVNVGGLILIPSTTNIDII